jgi:diguanylate cyclase (GGDEF)-like protein
MKNKRNSYNLSIAVVVSFAFMCLAFGIKVGYTDFFSRFYLGTGLPKATGDGTFEIKSMLCFLTMILYVGCLLIWKPYISIAMLTTFFMGFYALLDADAQNRIFADGEKVNYITFLISLTVVTVSIYQQRLREGKKSEELERIAIYDETTGIHNLHYFTSEVKALMDDPSVEMAEYKFLFINIENFKTFNDQMGFQEGNIFLKSFAESLEKIFSQAIVSRQADDHFAVLTKCIDLDERLIQLKDVLRDLSKDVYLELKVGGYVSIRDKEDPRRALDKARYASGLIKQKYGVYYSEYDDNIHNKYHKRQYIVNHIDQAVAEGWVKAFYQPVVWSEDNQLCGCEALARWIDPKYGFLSPGEFIPILEEHRLIHKLDAAIFEIVCKDIRDAMDNGKKFVPVSLNFSRLDFELMDAVKVLNDLVEKYNVPKDYIHVEVTESALTDNLNLLRDAMDKFHALGYAIWLDDFGSGYSSLNVLKDYKFDVLKIDMKFLSSFETNPKSKDIIQCVVDLAKKVDMKTLTEGVETKEQAEFLKLVGCGRLQGYLFGKPLPIEDIYQGIESGKYIVSDTII